MFTFILAAFAAFSPAIARPAAAADEVVCEQPSEGDETPDSDFEGSIDATLVLSELLPNPVGSDAEGEFIEIAHLGDVPVALDGWKLIDGKAREHVLDGLTILAGARITLPYADTGIPLANAGATISLIRPDGVVADTVVYGDDGGEGLAFARRDDGTWAWTTTPTPAEVNVFDATDDEGDGSEQADETEDDASSDQPTSCECDDEHEDDPSSEDGSTDEDEETDETEDAPPFVAIEALDGIEDGATVTVEGSVTFAPGEVGKTLVGLQDGAGAVMLRTYGTLADDVVRDARVRAIGKVSRTNGVVRLGVKSGDMTVIGNVAPTPVARATAEIGGDDEGLMVAVVGRVTDVRDAWFMMTDDGARTEIKIALDEEWSNEGIEPETEVSVVGVVRISGAAVTIIPRTGANITIATDDASDGTDGPHEGPDACMPTDDAAKDEEPLVLASKEDRGAMGPVAGIVGMSLAGATTVALRRRRDA